MMPRVTEATGVPGTTPHEPIRVLVVDDQELFRRGLTMLLAQDTDIEVVGEADDGIAGTDLADHAGARRGAARRPDAAPYGRGGLPGHQGGRAVGQDHHAHRLRRGGRPLRDGQERRLRLPAQGLLHRGGRAGDPRRQRGPVADQPVDGGQAASTSSSRCPSPTSSRAPRSSSPSASSRCCASSPAASTTARSPRSCSSPRTPSRTTSATSSRSSSSTRGWRPSCTPMKEKLLDLPVSGRRRRRSSQCASSQTASRRAGSRWPPRASSTAPHAEPDDADPRAHPGAHRGAPGRLGQRAPARPLHAALLADGRLRRRPAAAGARERRPRRMVEYWAHVQAFMPVDLWPVMQHRMADYREQRGKWGFTADPALEPGVLAAVRDRGPVTARDLDEEFAEGRAPRSTGAGTGRRPARSSTTSSWSATWRSPAAPASSRCSTTCPSGCCPAAVLAAPTPSRAEADLELVRRAARSHGVATAALPGRLLPDAGRPDTRAARRRRWSRPASSSRSPSRAGRAPAYLHRDARLPAPGRRAGPAQPVRPGRVGALAHRGALRLLLPDRDLRPGRQAACTATTCCRSCSATASWPGRPQGRPGDRAAARAGRVRRAGRAAETAEELAAELRRLAGWLGLDDVVVGERGDLAPSLAAVCGDRWAAWVA